MGYRTTWPGALSVRDDDGKIEIRACDPEGQNWRTLWAFSEMKDRVWPLGFGLDPQELYVRAHHGGAWRCSLFGSTTQPCRNGCDWPTRATM